jgi:AbrB family looped-hinge helix DNA binding protein
MGAEAKVTSKGQITLPAKLRAEFGIEPGDIVMFFRDLDNRPTFKVRRMRRGAVLAHTPWPSPPMTQADLDEGIGRAVMEDFARADAASREGSEGQ